MKAVARRIQRLESALTPQVDHAASLRAWEISTTLYRRRRRRAEAEGRPFTDPPPTRIPIGPFRQSMAEVLREARNRRRARAATQRQE
jgi:hypothetical protein